VIENLGKRVDKVIIGGGMAFTFIKAMGLEIGHSLVEDDMLEFAKGVQEHAFSRGVKFYLPVDCVVAAGPEPGAESKIVPVQEMPKAWYGMDIGPASVKLFSEAIQNAKTILWNGPMGVFENDAYARGTLSVAHSVANAYALTIVGGGDTALAVHRAGESESMSFISTGGGATLQLLEGKELPGLAALPDHVD
jgi:phosphoglycerate kinase